MDIQEFKNKIPPRLALMGIDYGSKRMGLAVSDLLCLVATPYKILHRRTLKEDLAELRNIIAEKEIGGIVLGLPLQMNGEEGEIAAEVRKFAAVLSENIALPILFWDERLSSSAMENFLIKEADLSRKKRRPEGRLKGKIFNFARCVEDDLSLSEPLLDKIYAAGGEYTQKLELCNVYCAPSGDASTRTRAAQAREGLEILTLEQLEELLG